MRVIDCHTSLHVCAPRHFVFRCLFFKQFHNKLIINNLIIVFLFCFVLFFFLIYYSIFFVSQREDVGWCDEVIVCITLIICFQLDSFFSVVGAIIVTANNQYNVSALVALSVASLIRVLLKYVDVFSVSRTVQESCYQAQRVW